jgi:CheY-like chemotaxis protein
MSSVKAHILHIDDDPALARLIERALNRRGYDVENVASSEAGLARLNTVGAGAGEIDAIVLDHFLPTGTGLDFLDALRALPTPPPVV